MYNAGITKTAALLVFDSKGLAMALTRSADAASRNWEAAGARRARGMGESRGPAGMRSILMRFRGVGIALRSAIT